MQRLTIKPPVNIVQVILTQLQVPERQLAQPNLNSDRSTRTANDFNLQIIIYCTVD